MKIGVIQLCSKLKPDHNLEIIRNFLQQANDNSVEAVFLPECFYSMSDGRTASPYLIENKNEHYEQIKNLAIESKMYILGGSAATALNGKVINRNYNFTPTGEELSHYDKIHLFSCDLSNHPSKKVINEADIYTAGTESQMINIGSMKIGLSICFDLRFPEMYRAYSKQGANVLSISAAFTVPTGKAHWKTLLLARAIENQCFVIAPAQWGENNDKIQTYGHSMIIDPWGEVLADAGEGEKLIMADLDFDRQLEIRSRISVL